MPGYLQSRECVLADDLTMAFSSEDLEKLDAAKRSPEMHYLDYEVQQLGKGLTLYDPVFLTPAPASVIAPAAHSAVKASPTQSGSKSDLFGKPVAPAAPPTQASPTTRAGRPSPPPPPPPPAAPVEEDAPEESFNLDELHIEEESEELDEKERNYGEFSGVIEDSAIRSGEGVLSHLSPATTEALLSQQNDDDELDLS